MSQRYQRETSLWRTWSDLSTLGIFSELLARYGIQFSTDHYTSPVLVCAYGHPYSTQYTCLGVYTLEKCVLCPARLATHLEKVITPCAGELPFRAASHLFYGCVTKNTWMQLKTPHSENKQLDKKYGISSSPAKLVKWAFSCGNPVWLLSHTLEWRYPAEFSKDLKTMPLHYLLSVGGWITQPIPMDCCQDHR